MYCMEHTIFRRASKLNTSESIDIWKTQQHDVHNTAAFPDSSQYGGQKNSLLCYVKLILSHRLNRNYYQRNHVYNIYMYINVNDDDVWYKLFNCSDLLSFNLLSFNVIWGEIKLYHSKGHIWLPICLLWTPSLYLVPFSRYSTSKFLGFDLGLWPLKIIWDQKILYHSKGHIWLPICLLWTSYLYLVPFSRYSTSNFLGFGVWGLGSKNIPYEKPYITSYLNSMDTISLSRTVFDIFDFKVFRDH